MKKIRLIELFAGYGSQALALKRLGLDFEHYRVVEFDKYAVRSYNAIHNTNFEPLDIRDIHGKDLAITETDKYNYLMTYSFPCTDLSLAGKQAGMTRGSGTRSGLLWEVERILKELSEGAPKLSLPQFLLMENVSQVHSEQNIKDFGEWISFLDSLGYISKWQDLNAKDYGIPQNRERCFMVSYLDRSIKYAFPKPVKLEKTVKDFLEDKVSEKYYIKTEKAEELINKLIIDTDNKDIIKLRANTNEGFIELENGGLCDLSYPDSKSRRGRAQSLGRLCPTITSSGDISKIEIETNIINPEPICLNSKDDNGKQPSLTDRVYSSNSTACYITTSPFFNPHYLIKNKEDIKTQELIDLTTKAPQIKNLANCITAHPNTIKTHIKEGNRVIEKDGYIYRIRKLTPLECFRLMDISDSDAKKMLAVNSETQCYKQAGNSIVVAVMVAIFNNLFLGGSEKEQAQIDIFDLLN